MVNGGTAGAASESSDASVPGTASVLAASSDSTPSLDAALSEMSDAGTATATDATGAASTASPVAKELIGDQVFDESEVRSYYLTLSDAEYAKLMDMSTLLLGRTIVNEDRYVEALQPMRIRTRRLGAGGVAGLGSVRSQKPWTWWFRALRKERRHSFGNERRTPT